MTSLTEPSSCSTTGCWYPYRFRNRFLLSERAINFINTEVDGFKLKTSVSRVVSHYAGSNRFLRIQFKSFDLILDSRLQVNKEPDYMSVLPTGYGHGKPRVYGEYKVLFTDVGYYACG
jgi:hypothetical protein